MGFIYTAFRHKQEKKKKTLILDLQISDLFADWCLLTSRGLGAGQKAKDERGISRCPLTAALAEGRKDWVGRARANHLDFDQRG